MSGPWDDYASGPWDDYAQQGETLPPPYGSGWSDNVLPAAGAAITDRVLGAKQRTVELAELFNPVHSFALDITGRPRLSDAVAAEVAEKRKMDAPLRAAPGGGFGYFLGDAAMAAPLALVPGANLERGSALAGGLLGLTQPTTGDESPVNNALIGAGFGEAGYRVGDFIGDLLRQRLGMQAVPSLNSSGTSTSSAGASAQATPGVAQSTAAVTATPTIRTTTQANPLNAVGDDAFSGLTELQRQMRDWGLRQGFRLTPGQATGNKALERVEARLESMPLTSGTFDRIKANNATRLTRAFLKEIGESGDNITPDKLARAEERMGAIFEDVATRNSVPYDDTLQAALSEIEQAAAREIVPESASVIRRQMENVLKLASENGGVLDGRAFQSVWSSLGRIVKAGGEKAHWAREMRNVLHDALERHATDPADMESLRAVRQQWRTFSTITNRQGAITGTGQISPGAAAAAVRQNDKSGYTLGRTDSDWYNSLRFSTAFPRIVGDSGTATRTGAPDVTTMLAQIPFRIATGAYASSPGVRLAVGAQAAANSLAEATAPVLTPAARRFAAASPYGFAGLGGIAPAYFPQQ